MLQLGLPKFVQLPLIDAIVLQMYQRRLSQCELDALEITIGRFYLRGVAVLDPVLNHLIGTYAFRTPEDRTRPQARPGKGAPEKPDKPAKSDKLARADGSREKRDDDDANPGPVNFINTKRKYLEFAEQEVYRGADFPADTYLLPPELPVIAHSIRNWSGVRTNGSTAAAHTGFPLNIGKYKKFIRRPGSTAIAANDYVEYETNRLSRQKEYRKR
jgi:hypothetical protein